MKITEITVHAGRVVPHPFTSYSNLKPGLSYRAILEEGEDALEATKELQARAESLLEDHCRHMVRSLQELEDLERTQSRVASLQDGIRRAQAELDELRAGLPGLPGAIPEAAAAGRPRPEFPGGDDVEDGDGDDDDRPDGTSGRRRRRPWE